MSDANRLLDGHPIDVGLVRRDLMQLLCMQLAKRGFLAEKSYEGPLRRLFDDFARLETTRLLLNSAIVLRIVIAEQARGYEGFRRLADTEDASLGRLREGKDVRAKISNLSLRVACNKLIHAREVTLWPRIVVEEKEASDEFYDFLQSGNLTGPFECDAQEEEEEEEDEEVIIAFAGDRYVEMKTATCPRTIELQGDYGGVEWAAAIDIIEYIKQGTVLALEYDNLKIQEREKVEEVERREKEEMKARIQNIWEPFRAQTKEISDD